MQSLRLRELEAHRSFSLVPAERRRARSRGQQLSLLFCNVTSWSALTKGYAAAQVSKVDAFLIAEHHVRRTHVQQAIKEARAMGWNPYFQPALDSPGGGTHGGVALLAQPGLAFQRFLTQVPEVVQVGSGVCWLFLELKLNGFSLGIGVCYLVASIGMTRGSRERMKDIC